MLLATIAILGPAVARLHLTALYQVTLAIDGYLIFFVLYDLWALRRIHRATIWGSLSILALETIVFPLGHSAFWQNFTMWIQNR